MQQVANSDGKTESASNDFGNKSNLKDSSIDTILKKRPTFIDNEYNKNLREDTTNLALDPNQNQTNLPKRNSSDNHSSLGGGLSSGKVAANGNSDPAANNKLNLFNEKTFLSFSSLGDFAEESDLDEQEDRDDQGISKYEDACHGLMIGTSSIVLKSLRTNSVILSNYGLNSVRVLALCNALKVTVQTLNYLKVYK